MDCLKFNSLISEYLDDALDEKTKTEFEMHLKECKKCEEELKTYETIMSEIHSLDMEELPEGYCKRLHKKLEAEKKDNVIKFRKTLIKYTSLVACFLLIAFVGIKTQVWNYGDATDEAYLADESNFDSGQATAKSTFAVSEDMDTNMESNRVVEAKSENSSNDYSNELLAQAKELKIIKNGNLSVVTENYDDFVSKFENIVKGVGGYFQNSSSYVSFYRDDRAYKNGEITARIPNEQFENILHGVESIAKIESTNIYETDVTKQYYDIDNKITNLEIQENRLRELYSKAENLTEILQLESEITRVRTQIDSYSMSLSELDDRVTYATLYVSIRESEEVVIEKPDNVFDKAKEGFIKTINAIISAGQTVFVWIISNLIYIVIILLVILILYKKVYKKFK